MTWPTSTNANLCRAERELWMMTAASGGLAKGLGTI